MIPLLWWTSEQYVSAPLFVLQASVRLLKYFHWMIVCMQKKNTIIWYPFCMPEWVEVDSNHRSMKQQIYSLSPLATRESTHMSGVCPDNYY